MMSFMKYLEEIDMKPLDRALMILDKDCPWCIADYEEAIELWITYGGD